jgi:class 3 adenylate cyclase
MLDAARWLAEQGLGHYAEAFAENGIAGDVLCDLTDPDLRELGLKLGDRKRLLKAIAALAAGSADARTDTTEPDEGPAVPREPERRQLTVLFVDLVASTELAARLDPEDMGEVIRAYHRCCTEAVERWDGHIAKYMGDGVLAYFGWPQAHEDEAERAVRGPLHHRGAPAPGDAVKRAARGADRHRNWPGDGGRADWRGGGPGADRGRRDAESCGGCRRSRRRAAW